MHHFNVCDVLSAAKACWEHALNWALGLKPASCQNGEITKCGFAGNDYSLWLGLSVLEGLTGLIVNYSKYSTQLMYNFAGTCNSLAPDVI